MDAGVSPILAAPRPLTSEVHRESSRRELPGAGRRIVVAAVKAVRLLTAVGLVAYAGHSMLGLGGSAGRSFFEDWLYNGLLLGAAALCLIRARLVKEEARAWMVIGGGLLSWSLGVFITTAWPSEAQGNFPTLSDLLSLGFYPAAYAGLILLLRARVQRFFVTLWLDGLVGVLALGALVAASLFPAILSSTGAQGTAVLADLSYPVADVLLVGFVLWVVALTGWRPGRTLGLVAVAFVLGALVDGFSLWSAATGHSTVTTGLDWLWPASTLLLATAAWQPPRPSGLIRLSGLRPLLVPSLFAASSLGLLALSRAWPIDTVAFALASATLAAVIARMALTFAENLQMVDRSRLQAITDAVTGLGNRRLLMSDLRDLLQITHQSDPCMLVLFDLDGFKRYNDTFGHLAGDALLARLGSKLKDSMVGRGCAYRLGGDEFCALIRAHGPEAALAIQEATEALSEHGSGFSVTTSYGAVDIPNEADDSTLALQIADQRLYAHKGERQGGESHQTSAVLKQVLQEREPELWGHLDNVASMSREIGRRMGLSTEELDEVTRAAELHDIGKLAVPDTVLRKPGRLDQFERTIMQQHTLVGERILGAAFALRPVAKLVRATHEHFDGNGYPDGLAGENIPLGARIIAVCDAFEAMTSDRPYQLAIPRSQALAELRRCAGTQFDPAVVEAFCQEVADSGGLLLSDSDRQPVNAGPAAAADGRGTESSAESAAANTAQPTQPGGQHA
jgi:diguanylate cyclase (GGDEF)-like protein